MSWLDIFQERKKLYSCLVDFLEQNGVYQAYLPTISTTVTNEPYTEPFEVVSPFDDKLYLQPSPEFYLKKLIAKENNSFFYIGPVYRANESLNTNIHLKEFDMLEWYKLDYTLDEFIDFTKEMFKYIFKNYSNNAYYKNKKLNINITEITWHNLFKKIDIDVDNLREECSANNQKKIRDYLSENDSFEDAFYKIYYTELYEQFVCNGDLWIIKNYPFEMSALAKKEKNIAKRFEMYWGGVELVNGYQEETDYNNLKSTFENFKKIRKDNFLRNIEIDEEFIKLTSQLSLISGASIGLDRLLFLFINREQNLDSLKKLQFFS